MATLVSVSEARPDDITVQPVTFPAPFFEASEPGSTEFRLDNVLEASGVEPIGDGRLVLVAHDKKVPLRVIETATGRQVGPLLTCDKFPAETPKSSKWEGMAQDSEGNYYLVGSHSGKTDGEREEHAKLIRFRLKSQPGSHGATDGVAIDASSVISWRIAGALIQALQHDGVSATGVSERKIEGLAIREHPAGPDGRSRRELVIGLRQPDDLVRAFTTDITTPPAAEAELPLARLFAFDPGEREGVRCQLTSTGIPRPVEGLPGRDGHRGRAERVPRQHALVRARWANLGDDQLAHPGRQGLDVRGGHESRGALHPAPASRPSQPAGGPPAGDLRQRPPRHSHPQPVPACEPHPHHGQPVKRAMPKKPSSHPLESEEAGFFESVR